MLSTRRTYTLLFALLAGVYIVLALTLPSDPAALARYNLSQGQAHLLGLTVVLPLVLIWFSALYGFLHCKAYARIVRESKEGRPFNNLADGLMVLAFGLPIAGIMSSLFNYVSFQSADLAPTATIFRNYIGLGFSLIGLLLLAKGAQGLVATLRPKVKHAYPPYSSLALILLASLFTWLIIARPSSAETGQAIYYLPNWLIVSTLAIPYLFAWYKGALAAYHLYLYKNNIKGSIYKRAFNDLAKGIGVIVGLSILLQFLTTMTARLNRLTLTPILLIIFVLIGLYAVGYGLVARGAKKLKKIEEV